MGPDSENLMQYALTRNVKKLSMLGHLRLQSAGGVFDISWNYKNMKELLNVIHR